MNPKTQLRRFLFEANTVPAGLLPRPSDSLDPRWAAQACWWYYQLAQKVHDKLGDTTIEEVNHFVAEGDLWPTTHYVNLKRSVAFQYGVTPDELDKFWPWVRDEAERIGCAPPNPRYVHASPLHVPFTDDTDTARNTKGH